MVIIATARMNDCDCDRSCGWCVTLVDWIVTLGLTGSLEHMGVPRPSLRDHPGAVAWEECKLWEPLSRVLALAGSEGLPRILPLFPHLPSQGSPSWSSAGLDLGEDFLLLNPAVLKPDGDLAL